MLGRICRSGNVTSCSRNWKRGLSKYSPKRSCAFVLLLPTATTFTSPIAISASISCMPRSPVAPVIKKHLWWSCSIPLTDRMFVKSSWYSLCCLLRAIGVSVYILSFAKYPLNISRSSGVVSLMFLSLPAAKCKVTPSSTIIVLV